MGPATAVVDERASALIDTTSDDTSFGSLRHGEGSGCVASISARLVRFDASSTTFAVLASAYRRALVRADRLLSRIENANEYAQFSKAKKLARKLERVEEELDAAREALQAHVRATTDYGRRSRAKRWSLRREALRVGRVA